MLLQPTEIERVSRRAIDGDELRYPGWCRDGVRAPERPLAVRLRVPRRAVDFTIEIQGAQRFDLTAEGGDFVIRRRDGLLRLSTRRRRRRRLQGITHVVRGADLLTARRVRFSCNGR